MDLLCMAVNIAAAAIVLVSSLLTVNSMGRATCHFIRATFALLAAGSFFVLCQILMTGTCPTPEQTVMNLGVAAFCAFDRRGRKRRAEGRAASVQSC